MEGETCVHQSQQHRRIASRLLWRCRAKPAGRCRAKPAGRFRAKPVGRHRAKPIGKCRAEPAGRAVWGRNSEQGAEGRMIELLPCGCRETGCSSDDGKTDGGP